MFDSILPTEVLILAIAPFSFILVDIPCELAMLPDVYILHVYMCTFVPSGRRQGHLFQRGQMYTPGNTFTKNIETFICYYISMPR